MHLWRTLLAVGVLAAFAARAAPIYKWTDASGVVHYSDQPGPGAKQITVDVDLVHTAPVQGPVDSGPAAPPPAAYAHFVIDSPTREQSFFSEAVPVHLTMQPALQPGHELHWTLNGKPLVAHAGQQQFSLPDLPRGEFTLTATVIDAGSNRTLNTDSVTFYEHRPSILNPHTHRPR
ncbi:MAG: DUF4124 domain-containing protein [Gammaproteobacteria bacterium]|nr:DUF4124 domain-containing protein [Gammaproteobacteria bacterium]